MLTLTVTTIAGRQVLIPDEETKQCLHLQDGDILCLTEAPDGAYRITPYDPEFVHQVELAERVMRDDHEIIRELVK